MKKYFFILLGVSTLILFLYFIFSRGEEIKNYPSKNSEIIAFGDSLIEGVGSTQGNDLISILSSKLDKPIRNFGRGGDTTALALERLPRVVQEIPNPKVVILLLGGNDFLRKVPKEETFRNLETIIKEFQSRGAVVLLLGIRGGVLKDNFKDEFESLHEKYQTAYVSNVLDGLLTKREYMYDSIHPNDRGYELLSLRIFPILKEISK